MSIEQRHNINVRGEGSPAFVFAHGFGCNQSMWRLIEPRYAAHHRTVRYDLAGLGLSEPGSYDRERHRTLHGHADDLIGVLRAVADGPVVLIAHSVSAMIGLLAGLKAPELFAAQVWLGPSPCYVNDGDYVGGFSRADIDELLTTLDSNYLGWSSAMAPSIMGAPDRPELGIELTNSFCRTDPDVARHFARVTFLSDHRAELARLTVPTLVVQCDDDMIVPVCVGDYMQRTLPAGHLQVIPNVGHCPHLSAPQHCIDAIDAFLESIGLAHATQ